MNIKVDFRQSQMWAITKSLTQNFNSYQEGSTQPKQRTHRRSKTFEHSRSRLSKDPNQFGILKTHHRKFREPRLQLSLSRFRTQGNFIKIKEGRDRANCHMILGNHRSSRKTQGVFHLQMVGRWSVSGGRLKGDLGMHLLTHQCGNQWGLHSRKNQMEKPYSQPPSRRIHNEKNQKAQELGYQGMTQVPVSNPKNEPKETNH